MPSFFSRFLCPFVLFGLFVSIGAVSVSANDKADLFQYFTSETNLWTQISPSLAENVLDYGDFRSGNPLRSTTCWFDSLPLDETLIEFDENRRVSAFRLSVVNRGDSGGLDMEEFEKIRSKCEALLIEWTGFVGGAEEQQKVQHAIWKQITWSLPDCDIHLVWGLSSRHRAETTRVLMDERAEFVRIDVLPKKEQSRASASSLSIVPRQKPAEVAQVQTNLLERIIRTPDGYVLIGGVPMVDQGMKGYCAVATISRIMQLYGMTVDQHEIAQLSNASPTAGTDSNEMMEVLRRSGSRLGITSKSLLSDDNLDTEKILQLYNREARRSNLDAMKFDRRPWRILLSEMDAEVLRRAKMSQTREYKVFLDAIRKHVDLGVPLAWSMVLGKVPEQGRTPQTAGGHMRLIIGYNDQTEELVFSDSWGVGHEAKRITMQNAWTVTDGLYSIELR